MHFERARTVNIKVNTHERGLTPLMSEYVLNKKTNSKTWRGRVVKWILEKLVSKGYIKHRTLADIQVEYEQVYIDYEELYEFLCERLYYFEIQNIEIETIVIGSVQFRTLRSQCAENPHIVDFYVGAECIAPSLRGKRIIINPHMEGVVCIPKHRW